MPREIKFEAPAHEQIILVMEMSFFFGIFFAGGWSKVGIRLDGIKCKTDKTQC